MRVSLPHLSKRKGAECTHRPLLSRRRGVGLSKRHCCDTRGLVLRLHVLVGDEVIALSKRKPVNVGNYAVGCGWEMMLNQLIKDTGAQFNVVKGTGAMLADLFAGHVDMGAGSLAGLAGGLKKGLVSRRSWSSDRNRHTKLPGIPTWVDAGFTGPAYEDLAEMNILMAPAGTPAEHRGHAGPHRLGIGD